MPVPMFCLPADNCWDCVFAVRVRTFNPVSEEVGRSICDRLGMTYEGVPSVQCTVTFRTPVSTDLVARNGNCVFLALLHGIGARKADHEVLRRAVFEHMAQPLIVEKLRTIYEETFCECEAHRTAEIGVNCNVCGIVIHAAASLLDVDVLVHWEAEDGKMEWMLGLCSLQKRVWGSCQIALRFLGNHVDFICRMK